MHADLPQLLRQADGRALLVPSRILRRVIKKHRRLGGLGLAVPHRQSYRIDRAALMRLTTPAELGATAELPEDVLLFPQPEGHVSRDELLVTYWRRLFHAQVHVELALDGLTTAARIAELGPVAFEEARDVLQQENLLFEPDNSEEVYEELAAVFLELRHFDPHRVEQYFPGLDAAVLERQLAADVDGDELFRRTRLEGAPDPATVIATEPAVPTEPPPEERTTTAPGAIRVKAEQVARAGNQVRAALLLSRAVAVSPPSQAGALHGAARGEIEALARRLTAALGLAPAEHAGWAACLQALLPSAAATRFWSVEARLLYDLQKVCVDVERPLFAADLVEWALSLFRRPIKRPLPDQPLVLVVKHLRSALGRVPAARMHAEPRARLAELLRTALHAAEARLRATLRPKLVETLDHVGLAPRNAAEALSRDRLVEELLDTISTRGTISIGDLRDAIARSRLKLPDLAGPVELVRGDALLRANAELPVRLDGIYRRGEVYLRWLQSLGSLFFGTLVGRLLTLYLILPLLGSLMILKGLDEVFHLAHGFLGAPHLETFHLYSFLGLALFLVPLIHVPPFRRAVFKALWWVWLGVRGVFYDLPAALLRLPAVRAVLQSKAYLLFWHFVGKPLVVVLPVAGVMWLAGVPWPWTVGLAAALFLTGSALLNSHAGLVIEETTADGAVRTVQLVRDDVVPGLIAWFQWVSRWAHDRIERALYSIDEALRFRQGQGRAAFVAKLLLGVVWFAFTWVFRLIYNVFFEPQVNPIKHFPVVTVAHKLTLAAVVPAAQALENAGFDKAQALATATGLQMATPGMWGFLAWELKENWRVYRANEPATVEPAVVGSHGEWVINLVRPGFHSGTLPKLYAKLRRAKGKGERKKEEGLHHVEEELVRFVERDFIAVLAASRAWPTAATIAVGHVELATNRVRLELCCPGLGPGPLWIEWANRSGWLVARITEAGWAGGLAEELRGALVSALTGLYKRAGVDLVEEHLAAALPAGAVWSITRAGLRVWRDGRSEEVDLTQAESAAALRFSAAPLTWAAWAQRWENDRAGKPHEPPLLPRFTLLPAAREGGA